MDFYLDREEDESGVSGVGIVAQGIQFPDGQCVLWWKNRGGICIYRSMDDVKAIHGHDGKTRIVTVGHPG